VNVCAVVCAYVWLLTSAFVSEASEEALFLESDAAHSDRVLRVPEPMVYDLVRPLGVKQGDLEVNALVDVSAATGDVSWAPELEYGLADDIGVELELPIENTRHERYKLAIQQTLQVSSARGMATGWQAFVDMHKHSNTVSVDATYIVAKQWTEPWSSLSMLGLRVQDVNRRARADYLLNHSVFYDASTRVTLGMEINQEISRGGTWRYRLTPQVHFDASERYTLQMGMAVSTLNPAQSAEKLWSFRLIRLF
jgi:hypothetical protein